MWRAARQPRTRAACNQPAPSSGRCGGGTRRRKELRSSIPPLAGAFQRHCLWALTDADFGWLRSDIATREHMDDRRIALSCHSRRFRMQPAFSRPNLPELRSTIAGQAILEADLASISTRRESRRRPGSARKAERNAEAALHQGRTRSRGAIPRRNHRQSGTSQRLERTLPGKGLPIS